MPFRQGTNRGFNQGGLVRGEEFAQAQKAKMLMSPLHKG